MKGLRRCLAVLAAVLLLTGPASAQQAATITGRVLDESGAGLNGVAVSIPALNIGAVSRADGAYTLSVPPARFSAGDTVVVRAELVGRQTTAARVVLAPGTVRQDITLGLDPLRLDELVVTGGGLVARAERLGTARATVSTEMLQRTGETNVVAALAAKAPNILTTSAGGDAGAATAIRIRGMTTMAGPGQPTIVVDGVPINNAQRTGGFRGAGGSPFEGAAYSNRAIDINPDDIESIEILKGPAAMSLLGASAGASGAILITTRRGRPGATRFTLRSEMQVDRPVGFLPVQQKFTSGQAGQPTPCYANPTPGCIHNDPSWGPRIAEGTPVYDHGRELFGTGRILDNTLTMSGGSDATRFYLSLGALDHDGYITGSSDRFQRYSLRLNADHSVRHNLQVGGNMSYVQTQGQFIARGNSVYGALMLPAFRAPPDFNHREYLDPQFGLHRSYRFPMPRQQDLVHNRGWDNPFFAIAESPNTAETGRVLSSVKADWQALPWLRVNYTVGIDYANDDRTEARHVSSSGLASGGLLIRHQFYERILDHTLTATANWRLSPLLHGTLSLGHNLNEEYMRQVWIHATDFIAPFPYKLENTVTRLQPSDREYKRRLAGHFAQAEVDYADQLFATARLRVDGSSAFGHDTRFAAYPGGQLAWVFTRTLDVPESILSTGRLRVAYGESGQEPALYQLQDVFAGTEMVDITPGSSIIPSLNGFGGLFTFNVLGNPDLRPERVRELDVGADLSLLRGRADLGVTYYHSNASDVVFIVQQPPSTGATTQAQNAAEIENRGWEVTGSVRPVQSRNVDVSLGLNWARNRNRVVSLGELSPGVPRQLTGFGVNFVGLGQAFAEVGQPLGVMRGTSFVRCGLSPDVVNVSGVGALNVGELCAGQPHGAVYIHENGLPLTDPNSRIVGDPNPDWTAGFNAEVAVRGVRVGAFLEHRQGGSTLNMTRGSMQQFGTHRNTEIRDQPARPWVEWLDHSRLGPTFGPGADVPVQLGQNWFAGWTNQQDLLVESATHTRLREVSLAYTFDQPWVSRLGMSAVDVRLAGRNLLLWSDYQGFDPDVHLGGAATANRGVDWWVHPSARSWVLSFGLTR